MDYQKFQKLFEKTRTIPTLTQESWPYLDFENTVVPHGISEDQYKETYSGWRLTLVFEEDKKPGGYVDFHINTTNGWEQTEIPEEHKKEVIDDLQETLLEIRKKTGIEVVYSENKIKVTTPTLQHATVTVSPRIHVDAQGTDDNDLYKNAIDKVLEMDANTLRSLVIDGLQNAHMYPGDFAEICEYEENEDEGMSPR